MSLHGKDRTGLLADPFKDWGFLSSGFLSYKKSIVRAASTWVYLHIAPWNMGVRGNCYCQVGRNKVLQPRSFNMSSAASVKLWQANLLACQQGENLRTFRAFSKVICYTLLPETMSSRTICCKHLLDPYRNTKKLQGLMKTLNNSRHRQ